MDEFKNICPGCFEEKGKVKVCPVCGFVEKKRSSSFYLPYR